MRNRAKCKLCNDVLESYHRYDYVTCKCGEISIDGGNDYCNAAAKDWTNFLRIDDDGKEIPIKVIDKLSGEDTNTSTPLSDVKRLDMPKITRADKRQALNDMIQKYEQLPQNALIQPCTHYDVLSVLLMIKSLDEDD